MTVSKADKKPKQGKNRGNLLTMTAKDDARRNLAKALPAEMDERKPPQSNIEAPAAEVAPEVYKGAKKALRHAVKARVKAASASIAAKLVEKVTQGDMKGTEIMLTLMEKAKEENAKKKKKRDGPSWVELLASEPEWDESMEGGGKKQSAGSGK